MIYGWDILVGLVSGCIGTLILDVANPLLARFKLIDKVESHRIGLMALNMVDVWSDGVFVNKNVMTPQDMKVTGHIKGILAHYGIGVILSYVFMFVVVAFDMNIEIFSYTIIYGVLTSVFAWFFMFPALGFGFFGLNAPGGKRLFRTSLVNHIDYGIGMAITFYIMNYISYFHESIFIKHVFY